jgi:hypothetical protein
MGSNGTSLALKNDLKTPQLNRADEVDNVSHEFSAVGLSQNKPSEMFLKIHH